MWNSLKDWAFGPDRPGGALLGMDPKEITEEDAVDAFCPYLNDSEYDSTLMFRAGVLRDNGCRCHGVFTPPSPV